MRSIILSYYLSITTLQFNYQQLLGHSINYRYLQADWDSFNSTTYTL